MYRKILKTIKSLYPKGNAFFFTEDSVSDKIHGSITEEFDRLFSLSDNIIDSLFPDSDSFTEEDATLWERRYGLKNNIGLGLALRKEIILRKMRHPDNTPYRQTSAFLQQQLHEAGFKVYVHENPPPYQTPEQFSNKTLTQLQIGDDTQVGDLTEVGGFAFPVVANRSLSEDYYSGGGVLWPTFFIGAEEPGEDASIDINRQVEFRDLILKIKPGHLAAYLLIKHEDISLQQELQYSL